MGNFEGCMENIIPNSFVSTDAAQIFEPALWVALDQTNGMGETSTYGVDWLALNHVRQLSEGSPPGALTSYNGNAVHGSPSFGQNLRIQGTFASSATLNITFKRNITVTANSGLLWTSTWRMSDLGKQIFIPSGVNGQGGGITTWNGYVVNVVSSTQAFVQPVKQNTSWNIGLAMPSNVSIGTNEPDANYFVFVQGASGETYGVSAITSTGFTVTSSNAASTATVTCLIVR
jgi:hypothetical protein